MSEETKLSCDLKNSIQKLEKWKRVRSTKNTSMPFLYCFNLGSKRTIHYIPMTGQITQKGLQAQKKTFWKPRVLIIFGDAVICFGMPTQKGKMRESE